MKISCAAVRRLGRHFVAGVRASDRDADLEPVLSAGWVLDDGANLLAAFRESYFGRRSAFADVGSYESAVNGRGIPDMDFEELGPESIELLMRRGTSFAWDALHAAADLPWKPSLLARVSVEPTMMDANMYTGYVTFFSAEFAEAMGIGEENDLPGIQIILASEDCVTPLPD